MRGSTFATGPYPTSSALSHAPGTKPRSKRTRLAERQLAVPGGRKAGKSLELVREVLGMTEADGQADLGDGAGRVNEQLFRLLNALRDQVPMGCLTGALGKSADEMTLAQTSHVRKIGKADGLVEVVRHVLIQPP